MAARNHRRRRPVAPGILRRRCGSELGSRVRPECWRIATLSVRVSGEAAVTGLGLLRRLHDRRWLDRHHMPTTSCGSAPIWSGAPWVRAGHLIEEYKPLGRQRRMALTPMGGRPRVGHGDRRGGATASSRRPNTYVEERGKDADAGDVAGGGLPRVPPLRRALHLTTARHGQRAYVEGPSTSAFPGRVRGHSPRDPLPPASMRRLRACGVCVDWVGVEATPWR
jgi:hypothetical protein